MNKGNYAVTGDVELQNIKESMSGSTMIDNLVIAFVSGNGETMIQVFDLLRRKIEGIAKIQANEDITCVDVHQKLPLCENLSQIINEWATHGWDETVTSKKLYGKDTRKEMELGAISYITRTVIIRKGDRCITYVHINPEMILDLSPCIGAFSAIYLDLCSAQSPVFKLGEKKDRQDGFRCIPFTSVMLADLSMENWFLLFRNYLEFPKLTGETCCRLDYAKDSEKGNNNFDSVTNTIVTMDSPVNLPDIATLQVIDPLLFLIDGDEVEDAEQLCQVEKFDQLSEMI